jgi:putative serine protease PepD
MLGAPMRSTFGIALAAALLASVATAGALLALGAVQPDGVELRQARLAVSGLLAAAPAHDGSLTAADVYDRAAPGVVLVRSHRVLAGPSAFEGESGAEDATASGFVVDDEGHIVTSAHVVWAATDVRVTVDGRTVEARVLGKDPSLDLAVLQVDAGALDLHPIALETAVAVGDAVVAIGSVSERDRVLATGVVAALGRSLETADGSTVAGVMQTDAVVDPACAGGPLLDALGRAVGVNGRLRTAAGETVAYAVPAARAAHLLARVER